MEVTYILTSRYLNGDIYSDKFETLDEVITMLQFINGDLNVYSDKDHAIDPSQVALTTEEQ